MVDDHATPQWLRKYFENWFDPCPLAPLFDGLTIEWDDPSFANIPYSTPEAWIDKAIAEAQKGKRIISSNPCGPFYSMVA